MFEMVHVSQSLRIFIGKPMNIIY